MALDPNIPLGVRPPQINFSGMGQSLGNLALMQDRQAQVEQRRRALEDDAAVRAALQTSRTPDEAIDSLYKQGRYAAAQNLSKSLLAHRKEQSDAATAQLTQEQKQIAFATQILSTAKDQKSWDQAYEAVSALNLPPKILSMVPKEYDPTEQQRLLGLGLTADQHLRQQQEAIANDQKAQELRLQAARDADTHTKNVLDAQKLQRQSAGQLLSTATNQGEWDQYQRLLAGQRGYDPTVLAEFGNTWSPDAAKRAGQLAMTPAERTTAAHDTVMERQGAERVQNERDRLAAEKAGQIGGGGGAGGRQLTPNMRASIEQKHQAALNNVDKILAADPANHLNNDPTAPIRPEARAAAKLRAENSYRSQIGLPSLEDAEGFYASQPGHDKDLRTIQNKYKLLTGTDAPILSLQTQIKTEKDPQKRAQLAQQLKGVRDKYAGMAQMPIAAPPAAVEPGGGSDEPDDEPDEPETPPPPAPKTPGSSGGSDDEHDDDDESE